MFIFTGLGIKNIISKKIFYFLSILFFLTNFIFAQQSLLDKGIELRDKGDLDESLKILKQAEKQDRSNNTEVLYHIALTYIRKNEIEDRIAASDYLEKALKTEPGNRKFLMEYALLKKRQGFKTTTEEVLKRIISLSSDNMEAIMELAEMYMEDGLWHKGMRNGRFSLDSFAKVKLEKAGTLLKRAINEFPDNPDPYYKLGVLYLHENCLDDMEKLFKRAVEIKPDFKDAYLFLGYAYYIKKDYEKADSAFEEAKKLMAGDEYAMMESFDRVFDKDAEIDQAYWIKRNPSYLEKANLRKLEHYSRLAYANLKFSVPKYNIQGWKTERGEIYIRWGKPRFISRSAPGMPLNAITLGGTNPGGETSVSGKSGSGKPWKFISSRLGAQKYFMFAEERWFYEDYSFNFEDRYLSRHYILDDFPGGWGIPPYDEKLKNIPEKYKDPFENIKVDFPYYIASFKGETDLTDFEIFYVIPLNEIPSVRMAKIDELKLEGGVFVFDEQWNPIRQEIKKMTLPADGSVPVMTSAVQLTAKPGKYNITIEFKDEDEMIFGQQKVLREIEPENNTLTISDIIIGVGSQSAGQLPGRAGLNNILPVPSLIFINDQIRIYFEVYNLELENNKTDFSVTLSVSTPKPEKKGLAKLAGKFLSLFKKEKGAIISSTYSYTGTTPDEKVPLDMDISKLEPGNYVLSIEVNDKKNKESTVTKRFFEVRE
ncbi:tetratricopeptide repeat protein [candidate division KSB1 bacterium]